jgi:hypothetical protein
VSTVYPGGDATLAWQALADRYEPQNAVDQQTLITELFAYTLESDSKAPKVWIVELQIMQTKLKSMGATVSDNMVMGHILSRLTPESLVDCHQDRITWPIIWPVKRINQLQVLARS